MLKILTPAATLAAALVLVPTTADAAPTCGGKAVTIDLNVTPGASATIGDDVILGTPAEDVISAGDGKDTVCGMGGDDVVYGNMGADTQYGGDGADWVRGGQGNDSLSGGAGADWMSGDRGDDTLSGGAGADLFNIFGDAGVDRVLDFNAAEGDRVQVEPGSTYAAAQVGSDVVVTLSGGAQMILVNVGLSSLTDGWISFG